MPQGYEGLPSYYSNSSNPITPNLGLSLKGMDPIVAEDFVLIDTFAGLAGAIQVNGAVVPSANFNNLTPAAPPGGTNVLWQHVGSSVSAYVVGVMTTLGDMLYEDAIPGPHRLAGNITVTKMYLSQTGTGAVSAAPVWAQINYADITGIAPVTAWSALTGTLSNGQVIPYGDAGISRLGAASLAIGNGAAGDTTGTLTAQYLNLTSAAHAGGNDMLLSMTDTHSLGNNTLILKNDVGVNYFMQVGGSSVGGGVGNSVFIGAGTSGAGTLVSLNFTSNANVASGGTSPIKFQAGGYSVTPQLAV